MEIKIQEVLAEYKENLPSPDNDWPHEIQRIKALANENLFETHCTVGFLKRCNVTPKKNISLRFKRYVGMNISQYIIHHRVEASKYLLVKLRDSYHSISDIGFSVGKELPSSFSTIFKLKTGLSP
jgi:AraC-like DNA-binding protein